MAPGPPPTGLPSSALPLPFRPSPADPIHWVSKDLRALFGGRVSKACLDGGFSCPNRDGTRGLGGCAWCDPGGAGPDDLRPGEGWEARLKRLGEQAVARGEAGVVAYFQAFTPTYGPPARLGELLDRAASAPGVVALAVGARPDCLAPETLEVLERAARARPLWVEVGMQSARDDTLAALKRGHGFAETRAAARALRERSLPFVLHLIAGLPGEAEEDLLASHAAAVALAPWGLKVHPLHVVRGSALEGMWRKGGLALWERDRYVSALASLVEATPPEIAFHRLTGERPEGVLLAPGWCRDKRAVLGALQRELSRRNSFQGRKAKPAAPGPPAATVKAGGPPPPG